MSIHIITIPAKVTMRCDACGAHEEVVGYVPIAQTYSTKRREGWEVDGICRRCLCPRCVRAGKKLPG